MYRKGLKHIKSDGEQGKNSYGGWEQLGKAAEAEGSAERRCREEVQREEVRRAGCCGVERRLEKWARKVRSGTWKGLGNSEIGGDSPRNPRPGWEGKTGDKAGVFGRANRQAESEVRTL